MTAPGTFTAAALSQVAAPARGAGTAASATRTRLSRRPNCPALGGVGLDRRTERLQAADHVGRARQVDRPRGRLAGLGVVERARGQAAGVDVADLVRRGDQAAAAEVLVLAGLV